MQEWIQVRIKSGTKGILEIELDVAVYNLGN
jgi:hypothetical protein